MPLAAIPFPAWDDSLFVVLNSRAHAPWMDAVIGSLTSASNFRPLIYALALLPLFLLRGRARATWLVAWLAVGLTDLAVDRALKPWFHRCRPIDAGLAVRALGRTLHTLGFPSAHAANLAAFATAGCTRRARWAAPMVVMALVVGYSRVYVGVHRPLDVLAGWATGALVGLACVLAWNRVADAARE